MVAKSKLLKIILSLYLLFSVHLTFAENKQKTLTISGDVFKACIITSYDFEKMLVDSEKDGSDLDIFLSDIKNYTISVEQDKTKYIIKYIPNDFHGEIFFGGGGKYEVSRNSFVILKKEYFE